MTAIISAFTKNGFIIGADGRTLGKDDKIVCESTQKNFHFKYRRINVAYMWCGTVRHMDEAGAISLDLDAITRETLDLAARTSKLNFANFIQECCEGIYDGICRSPGVKKLNNSTGEDDSRARMLVNGFFGGVAFSAEFYLRDKDRIRVDASEIHIPLPSPTRNLFSGCGEQNKKYFAVVPSTVEDSIRLVTDFIQACIDNSEPDCFKVGGHRHIAYLSPDDFSWIDEPCDLKQSP